MRAMVNGGVFSGALVVLVASGCSSSSGAPFDRVAATEAALQNTSGALHGTANSSGFLEQSTVVPKITGSSEHLQFKDSANKSADDLTKTLRERVFADGNLESSDDTSATFLLRPSVECEPADTRCNDFFTKNPIRLRLTSPAEGDVDVAFLYGEQRFNPLTFHLYRTSLGLTVDLGASGQTIKAIGGDQVTLPDQLQGSLLFEIVKNAELDFSFRTSVESDIAVSWAKDGKPYAFGMAATHPTWEARANGNTKTLTLTENIGHVTAKLPLSSFVDAAFNLGLDDGASDDPVDMLLAGLTGSVTLDGAADHLHMAGLGLGDTTTFVKRGQDVLFSMDANPNNGRAFDLDFTLGANDETMIQVSPLLDFTVHLGFSLIADKVKNLPQTALNDTLRVLLSGDVAPVVKAVHGPAWSGDGLQVVSGQLTLTSSAAPQTNVTVGAGQCLLSQTPASGDENAWSKFTAGSCQ